MANIHPSIESLNLRNAGAYKERDVLITLQDGLPQGFDVFHSVNWSTVNHGQQRFGEIDAVVVAPQGHIVLLEVKAGDVSFTEKGIFKSYGKSKAEIKNVGGQIRAQQSAWAQLLDKHSFRKERGVTLSHFLVVPDMIVKGGTAAYPRERIVDSTQMDQLCNLIHQNIPVDPIAHDERTRLIGFLQNQFQLLPDPSVRIGQVKRASMCLAEGLATWAPRVQHHLGAFQIEGTAGSGKTQLALALLQTAVAEKRKCAYFCFNRPLADHMIKVSPPQALVSNFHEMCIDYYSRNVGEPDFSDPNIFKTAEDHYIAYSRTSIPHLDLLIIDEGQDFYSEWIEAIVNQVKGDGQIYLLSDPNQALYDRPPFELNEPVVIQCMDNFRSPTNIVAVMNYLKLSPKPISAKSPYAGDFPEFVTYDDLENGGMTEVASAINQLVKEGHQTQDITLLSYAGRERSKLLALDSIGKRPLIKWTGKFDANRNAVWTEGELLAETISRFKGQSSPVIVLCEVDFLELNDKELRKLFVGFSRAQFKLVVVLLKASEKLLNDWAVGQE